MLPPVDTRMLDIDCPSAESSHCPATVSATSSIVAPYLEVTDVRAAYRTFENELEVLNGLSFRVNEGEVMSLLGPSGCGKSTLFNVLSGLHQPTSGEIKLNGQSVVSSRQHAAYQFQDHSLLPWRTVLHNVLLPAELEADSQAPEARSRRKDEALELLSVFGLEKFVKLYPSQLSGGMRQRVALARTFMANRQLYLFDEPFTGLDFFRRLRVEKMMADFLHTHRKTCLLITHDLETALAISHRILILTGPPCVIQKEISGLANITTDPVEARRHPQFEEAVKKGTEILTDIFESSHADKL